MRIGFLAVAVVSVLAATRGPAYALGDDFQIIDPSPQKRASYVPPTKELFQKFRGSVVRIRILLHGVPIENGSGFFVSKDGLLITSRRLMRSAFIGPEYVAEIKTIDGKIFKDPKVADCGGLDAGNLCALKIAYEPKTYLTFAPAMPELEGGVAVIGHPKGSDFAIAAGKVEAIGKTPDGLDQLEVSLPMSPGNTGAPVIDDHGRLVGIAGPYDSEHADRQVLFAAGEAKSILAQISERMALPMADARRLVQETLRKELRRRVNDELDPALGFAMRAKPLNGWMGFKETGLKFDDRLLHFTVPGIFDDCSFTQKTRESTLYACFAFGDAAILTVQRMPAKGHEDLLTKSGKKLLESRPLNVADALVREGDWEIYEPILTTAQKKAFSSDVQPAQCQVTKKSAQKNPAFSEVAACRFTVNNDSDAGAQSVNIWLLKNQYLYAYSIWIADPSLNEYFSRVPILAVLSSRWEKQAEPKATNTRVLASEQLEPKPMPTYRIELPDTLSFMGSKMMSSGTRVDLYGKKLLLDSFEEGFFVAVTSEQKSYLAPDFDDVIRRSATKIARDFGAKIQPRTIELEPWTIGNEGARLLTAFGTDKQGHDVLILSGAIFFENQTFEFTQIASPKDPAGSFKEFKTFLRGFRRK